MRVFTTLFSLSLLSLALAQINPDSYINNGSFSTNTYRLWNVSEEKGAPIRVLQSESGGRRVQYDLLLSEGIRNPDGGGERMVYLLNGQFPGQQLTLEQGDEVEVFVTSNLSQPTSIHWHGIHQTGTPWSDGVPGVSQKEIMPGANYTYRWTAYQHGLYHAHSHRKQMQDDGLTFPVFIRPSPDLDRPFERIAHLSGSTDVEADIAAMIEAERNTHVFTIMDWRHYTSDEILAVWHQSLGEPLCVDAVLLNGMGASICPPESEINAYGSARNISLTRKGCQSPYDPIINPPVFAPDSHIEVVPHDVYLTCPTTGYDSPLYGLQVDTANSTWLSVGIVNVGGLWETKFSIDQHQMWIYAVEGDYISTIKPHEMVSLPSGIRYQALIKLDKDPGTTFAIRAGANVLPQVISGFGTLQYAGPPAAGAELVPPAVGYPAIAQSVKSMDYSSLPQFVQSGLWMRAAYDFDPLIDGPPYPSQSPPQPDPSEITTIIQHLSRPTAYTWADNSTGLQPELYEDIDPLIWEPVWTAVLEAQQNGTGALAGTPLINAASINFATNGSIVDLVMTFDGPHPPHPMHKHFNKFFVVGQALIPWRWNTVAEAYAEVPEFFNFENPPLRDGYNSPAMFDGGGGFVVFRYQVTTPSADVLHCHLSQHVGVGMISIIMESPELIELPAEYGPPA